MSDRTPTHVVAQPGDKRSLCGIKDPLPRTWEKFVAAHVAGYGLPVCGACETEMNRRSGEAL